MHRKLLALGAIVAGLAMTAVLLPKSEATFVPTADAAAVDYFLEIEGIQGESSDNRSPGQIEISSFSWGVSQKGASSGGGGGAGKASFQDIHFTTNVSKASPMLMLATATGQHFKKAVLHVRKSGGDQQDFYVVRLEDVLVSSYQSGGSSGAVPTDQFSLNFTKIEFSYSPQRPDGSLDAPVKAGYDLKQNKKI